VSSASLILTDRGLALSEPVTVGAQGSTKVLAASSLGGCLVFVSSAVVAVALAAIGRDMRLSPLDLQWVMNAELLPLAALTLVAGALGDRFGQKRIFLAGSLYVAWARPRLVSRRVSSHSSSAGSCKAWAKP
jgi:MFS family permease